MATDQRDDAADLRPAGSDYAQGMRTGIRNNSSAYGFSVLATVSFGALTLLTGDPGLPEMFGFVLGASLGFAVVEAAVSRGFRDQVRGDRSNVVVLGSAVNLVSISVGLGGAVGVAHLWRSWLAWIVAPFVATMLYLLVVGVEVAFARRAERRVEESD